VRSYRPCLGGVRVLLPVSRPAVHPPVTIGDPSGPVLPAWNQDVWASDDAGRTGVIGVRGTSEERSGASETDQTQEGTIVPRSLTRAGDPLPPKEAPHEFVQP